MSIKLFILVTHMLAKIKLGLTIKISHSFKSMCVGSEEKIFMYFNILVNIIKINLEVFFY